MVVNVRAVHDYQALLPVDNSDKRSIPSSQRIIRDSQSTRFLRDSGRDSGRDSKRLNPLLNRGNGESPLNH
jgi:hypothetical protein